MQSVFHLQMIIRWLLCVCVTGVNSHVFYLLFMQHRFASASGASFLQQVPQVLFGEGSHLRLLMH